MKTILRIICFVTLAAYAIAQPTPAGGGGGGVAKIVAGDNISITPVGGTGNVTVNSTGNVAGPASSTATAIARYSDTTGKVLLNSSATIDSSGNLVATSITSAAPSGGAGTWRFGDYSAGLVQISIGGVLRNLITDQLLGTGVLTAIGTNVGSAGSVVVNGGALGTPSTGNLANCTAAFAGAVSGSNLSLGTTFTTSGNTFTTNSIVYTLPGTTSTLASTADLGTLPQNSQSAAYTFVLSDVGKHVYHPSSDTTARIWTIPANSSVAYPIGTLLCGINDSSAGVLTITITTDTLVQSGTGATGNRTVPANGRFNALKVTSTRWIIDGAN